MKPIPDQSDSSQVAGILAEFDGPEALRAAAAGSHKAAGRQPRFPCR